MDQKKESANEPWHGPKGRERKKKKNRDSTCGAHTHGPTRRVHFNPTIQQSNNCCVPSIQFSLVASFGGVCPSKSTNKPREDGCGYLFWYVDKSILRCITPEKKKKECIKGVWNKLATKITNDRKTEREREKKRGSLVLLVHSIVRRPVYACAVNDNLTCTWHSCVHRKSDMDTGCVCVHV